GDNRPPTRPPGIAMPSLSNLVRVAVVLAVLAAGTTVDAQRRSAPAHATKLKPKIGSVAGVVSAEQLAAMLTGPGVTIANARFTGDSFAAGTFSGGLVDIGIVTGVVLSTGHAEDVQGTNSSDAWS